MKLRLPLFFFAILLFMSSTAVAQPKTTGIPQFDAAAQRAAAYLRANLKEDDTAGHYVLSAYALFKAGEPKDSPIIQRAIKHATDSVSTSGTFRPQRAYDHLYESGLYCMFLADVDPELYQGQIQIMANYVASVQKNDGSWADTPQAAGDISMCQYAVLALWAANRAKCTVSPEALDRTVSYHLSHRNPDGGYSYRPGTSFGGTGANSNRNMTMAAVSSLGVARLLFYGPESANKDKEKPADAKFGVLVKEEEENTDSAVAFPDYRPRHSKSEITSGIERALAYETANFNPRNNHPEFPNYFYYTIERALTVSEIHQIKGEDWYVPYGHGLLTFQDGEGAFKEVHGGAIVGTSFALLYFMRSTKQIIEKTYGVGRQQGKRGNPFGDKEVKREPTELDLLIADMEKLDPTVIDDAPIEVADEIVRSVISIDDPEKLVGQADKLKSLMKHPNADVRKSACWALGRTGDFKLVPFMLDGIRDPSVDVNVEAIAALRFIARKPNGFGETLSPLEGVENPTDEQKVRIVNEWRQKAINSWSAWYSRVRPHEDQDGFDQLLLAVPLNSKTVEENKK